MTRLHSTGSTPAQKSWLPRQDKTQWNQGPQLLAVPSHMWVAAYVIIFRWIFIIVQKWSFFCYHLQVSYENTSQDHRQPPLIIQVLFLDNWIEISCFSFPAWPLWTEGELHIPGKADSSFDWCKVCLLSNHQPLLSIESLNPEQKHSKIFRRSIILPDLRNHGESPPSNFMSLRWVSAKSVILLVRWEAQFSRISFAALSIISLFFARQMSADLQRLTSHLGVSKVATKCLLFIILDISRWQCWATPQVEGLPCTQHSPGDSPDMKYPEWKAYSSRPELVSRLVVAATSPLDTEASLLRWERNKKAMKIMAEIYEGLSEETMARLNSSSEFKLSANTALKEVLTDSSERALFLSNLGKVNVRALLRCNMELSTFPDMDGRTFDGPTLFISGEKEPVWKGDGEVRRIRQLFPNSRFVKLAGASYWPHTEANKEFLMQTVAFLQTKFYWFVQGNLESLILNQGIILFRIIVLLQSETQDLDLVRTFILQM